MVLTIVLGLLGLGIMVFVHELGHFVAAKAVGIGVEVFSLGWGRRLVGFVRRDTVYQIALFPVGGYCRLKGEEVFRGAVRDKLESFPYVEGSFYSASPLKRILVAVSGPLANVLFAVLVLSLIWLVGFDVYSSDSRIVLASDYTLDYAATDPTPPATESGLHTGDRVVAIDGQPISNFQELTERVAVAADRPLRFRIERGGTTSEIVVTPELDRETGGGRIGVYAWTEPVVESVELASSAHLAELEKGDRITALDGNRVSQLMDIVAYLNQERERVQVSYERDGVPRSADMRLVRDGEGRVNLGIAFRQNLYRSPVLSPIGALREGAKETWRSFVMAVTGLVTLFRGVDLQNAVAGPLRISYYVGSVATSGFAIGFASGVIAFFRFLCLLSVVLFVMNLLPVPAFDGGQIVLFVLEMARRKAVKPRFVHRMQLIGFAVIASLLVVFTFSDILFFVGR